MTRLPKERLLSLYSLLVFVSNSYRYTLDLYNTEQIRLLYLEKSDQVSVLFHDIIIVCSTFEHIEQM